MRVISGKAKGTRLASELPPDPQAIGKEALFSMMRQAWPALPSWIYMLGAVPGGELEQSRICSVGGRQPGGSDQEPCSNIFGE